MIKIPYGISDYRTMIEDNYFYQDRTSYIQKLENWGPTYLLYLRPRRFGKSLWISTLHYYYGLEYKNNFQKLFGETFIGQNPTTNANTYMVLRFDFSAINTSTEQGVFDGFTSNVSNSISIFLSRYNAFFNKEQVTTILQQKEPQQIIKTLFKYCIENNITHKIYILIDEYDHFTNELISFNFNYFLDTVTRNGYVHKFYEAIKIASGQGIVGRMFITGVSPITVDSLTSGFNIASNITLSSIFHQMTGFDEGEVAGILKKIDIPEEKINPTMVDMRLWYNGYLFDPYTNNRVYNPNMVLYFANAYAEKKRYPHTMLDANIASDYSKIEKIFSIQGKKTENLKILVQLSEIGKIRSQLTDMYHFEQGFSQSDLVSLLFYMGFLTIDSENLGDYTFVFPNYAIRRLYANFFFNAILKKPELPIDNRPVNEAIINMATTGNPKAFFDQVSLVLKYFSTRDSAHFSENTLKAIIMSLLHQQNFYYLHSEYETDWTYMDVFLEAIAGQKPNFDVAMELKYITKGGKKAVNSLFEKATAQLKGYLETPKFKERTNIKSYVVVVAGEKLEWRELK